MKGINQQGQAVYYNVVEKHGKIRYQMCIRDRAGILGHSQPSTTLDIYTHAFDKNKKAASAGLQGMLDCLLYTSISSLGICARCSSALTVIRSIGFCSAASRSQYSAPKERRLRRFVPLVSTCLLYTSRCV